MASPADPSWWQGRLLPPAEVLALLDAADRLEEVTRERDEWRVRSSSWKKRAEEAEANAAASIEALIWCSGSADFGEGGIARAGWLKGPAKVLSGTAGRALLDRVRRMEEALR